MESPPLYLIDSGDMRHSLAAKFPEGGQLFPNVHFLGRIGIKSVHGLSVAFVSGQLSDKNSLHGNYSQEEIERFCLTSDSLLNPEFRGTDLFISCQWPGGISFLSSQAGQKEGKQPSWALSKMAYLCKPRYLISAGEDLFYKREPFVNGESEKGHATGLHVCRFVGLAKLANKEKGQQSFFGFQVDPINQLADPSSICLVPPESTANPFDPSVQKATRQANKRMASDPDRLTIEEINQIKENTPLFFAGFPAGTTHQEIEEFIGEWGSYSELLLLSKQQGSDRRGNQKPTYGFVTFSNVESIKQALRDSGLRTLRNRPVYFKKKHGNQQITKGEFSGAHSGTHGQSANFNQPFPPPPEGLNGGSGFGGRVPSGYQQGFGHQPLEERRHYPGFGIPPAPSRHQEGGHLRGNGGVEENPCWFCFNNPKIDKSLIFYEGKHVYLALDKGPIVPYHMLLIPKRHYGAKAFLGSEALDECRQLEAKAAEFFFKENKTLVSFERNLKLPRLLSHMHMNMIGIDRQTLSDCLENLEETVRKLGVQFFHLKDEEDITSFVDGSEERRFYLSLSFHLKRKLLCILSQDMANKMPKDFLRSLVCQAIGMESKADWKTVQMDQETLTKSIEYLRNCFA